MPKADEFIPGHGQSKRSPADCRCAPAHDLPGHSRTAVRGRDRKGFEDLNQPLLNVFLYPPPDRVRPSELAERANMTKQAMNYLLGQLEARGYIERRAQRGSSRRLVFLTDRGWQVRQAILTEVTEVEAEWTVGSRSAALRGVHEHPSTTMVDQPPWHPKRKRRRRGSAKRRPTRILASAAPQEGFQVPLIGCHTVPALHSRLSGSPRERC